MKKGLLTTSALVAAGMFGLSGHADAAGPHAMNPVQLKVGGYMEQFVGFAFQRPRVDTGYTNSGTLDQQTEAEIHFTGQARLDNGLQIRAHVEYEVAGSPGNMIDEQTLTLRNGFGQVILGNEDPVSSLMVTGYATTFVTSAGGSLTYDVLPWVPYSAQRGTAFGSPTQGALQDEKLESFDNDASKITYVSPRIGGLQVGVSYVPDSQQQLAVVGANQLRSLPGHQTGAPYVVGWSDGWAIASNYTIAIDMVHIGIAAGYETANGNGGGLNAATLPSTNNPWQAGGGMRVDYGPYRVVAGYKRVSGVIAGSIGVTGDQQHGPDANHSGNGHMWMAGGMYTFGPNAVSLDWQRGTEDGIIGSAKSERLTVVNAAYSRHLAPGIRAAANLAYADYTGQPGIVGGGAETGGVAGNRGFAFYTSFRLDF